jgi:hypothetical protein
MHVTKRGLIGASIATALAVVGASSTARADVACEREHLSSQQKRAAGELVDALEDLGTCSREECPPLIQSDCATWREEVSKELPTIVPAAREGGHDLSDVKVSLDGNVVLEAIDGRSIQVDPGSHTLRFELPDKPPLDVPFVAKVGQKDQLVSGDFGGAASTPTAPADDLGTNAIVAIALGSSGGAMLIVAGALLGAAETQYQSLDDSGCKPNCDQDDIDQIASEYLGAEISLGIGLALGAAAVVVYLVYPADDATAVSISVAPTPGGVISHLTLDW